MTSSTESPLISCAFDCLLAITDCIKDKIMTIEDQIVTTSKSFWSLKDIDKEKFQLLVNWGLYNDAFDIKAIGIFLLLTKYFFRLDFGC